MAGSLTGACGTNNSSSLRPGTRSSAMTCAVSASLRRQPSLSRRSEDLATVLKCAKADKAYVVGLSLGGRIAIDFTLAHPEMVDALIPVAPGLSGFNLPNDPNEIAILKAAQAGDFQKATDLWLQSGYMAT